MEQAQRLAEQARQREQAAREARERASRERQRQEQQQRLREQIEREQREQQQRQYELQEQQWRLHEQMDRQRQHELQVQQQRLQEQIRLKNMRFGQQWYQQLHFVPGLAGVPVPTIKQAIANDYLPAQSMTDYRKLLLPAMKADRNYNITSYSAALKGNKERLLKAFDALAIREERRTLMMAMAMIETNTMSPSERDTTKDRRTDKSANASIFNLSEDMLNQLGYQGNIHLLDPLESLPIVVGLINKGIDVWGVTRMLNFVRGGRKAFNDGVSYGAADYRNAVATILKVIDMYPALMRNDRRVEIYVPHQ